MSEWPIKSAKEIAFVAREGISKLQKKAFVAVLTRAQTVKQAPLQDQSQIQVGWRQAWSAMQNLVDVK